MVTTTVEWGGRKITRRERICDQFANNPRHPEGVARSAAREVASARATDRPA
jgi:hypothetical protein